MERRFNPSPRRWTHPAHARVKTQTLTPTGPVLTDARIRHYILQGRYGDVQRRALLVAEASRKPAASRLKKSPVADALALLDSILT